MKSMRRVVCALALVLGCSLLAASPALALPHFGKARTNQISTLVARFVNDLVLRKDLADAWAISGPAERGAITRKAWMSGHELPVQHVDVLNDPRTAWYAKWKDGNEIGLVVSLRTGHGKNAEMLQVEAVLLKTHGRWLVNAFYVDGIFRLGGKHSGSCVSSKCRVTGLSDYMPGGAGGGIAPARPHIPLRLAVVVVLSVAGLVVLTVLGILLRRRRRYRRALASYLASR